jgi:predicted Fe-Mo cluster-binding NifX family protein
MNAAFAIWRDRIAPVFDVARYVRLVDISSGLVVQDEEFSSANAMEAGRISNLNGWNVRVLVCGAISRSLLDMISASGIHVFPFIAGNIEEIIHAWIEGKLYENVYSMPGCGGRGLRCRNMGILEKDRGPHMMKRQNQGGWGGCISQSGDGRTAGSSDTAGNPSGVCICPKCGQRKPHRRGEPCFKQTCPQCGSVMTRG